MTDARARPARAQGSTIRTVVALAFVSPPPTEALKEALSLHDRIRERYPRRQEIKAVTVSLNPDAMVAGMDPGEVAGFTFDYSKPDGTVKQAMGCTDKVLYVQRTDSPDLGPLRDEVQEEFGLVIPALGGERSEYRSGASRSIRLGRCPQGFPCCQCIPDG